MNTPEALALGHHAIVRFRKSARLYVVLGVSTQRVLIDGPRTRFISHPRPAVLTVRGWREGKPYGPIRALKAADCAFVA